MFPSATLFTRTTNLSKKVNAPIYVLLTSDIGSEARFGAAVASRMKTLGALSKGDRRAAGSGQKGGVEDFDIDEGIGKDSLVIMLRDLHAMVGRSQFNSHLLLFAMFHPVQCA